MDFLDDTDETERARALALSLDYLTEEDICSLYGITASTCLGWRKKGRGPQHIIAGARTLYPKSGVAADLQARLKERRAAPAKAML